MYEEIIIVHDYPFSGQTSIGTIDGGSEDPLDQKYWLDDGDIYTIKQLKESDYSFDLFVSEQALEWHDLLEKHQWVYDTETQKKYCPECGSEEAFGHENDCRIKLALDTSGRKNERL
jgi:hypothetical protein